MIRLSSILLLAFIVILSSCEKEYSVENSGGPSDEIIGVDCRITKIAYTDTATNTGTGALTAVINSLDIVTKITKFDSLSNTIEFIASPLITNDTIYINPDEYFIVDFNKRVKSLHGLVDPTDPFSTQFDISYVYNSGGFLFRKIYTFTAFPGTPFYEVNYTYAGGNLTKMTGTDKVSGDLITDATMTYHPFIIPKRFIYIFPDEKSYPNFTQFYDFGNKSFNAVKDMTVRNYDPGNVLRDSLVSTFSSYSMSRDTYVLSVMMSGDDQPSIPAAKGKLSFSYKCK